MTLPAEITTPRDTFIYACAVAVLPLDERAVEICCQACNGSWDTHDICQLDTRQERVALTVYWLAERVDKAEAMQLYADYMEGRPAAEVLEPFSGYDPFRKLRIFGDWTNLLLQYLIMLM